MLARQADEHRKTVINYVASLMTDKLKGVVNGYLHGYSEIREIRLRVDTPIAFTLGNTNLITGVICERKDFDTIIERITGGSFYSFSELMKNGYITMKYGLRAGVCGDVFVSDGSVTLLKQASYLNIRLPSTLICDCSLLTEHIINSGFRSSVLVFSPPCCGKTTLLRSVAYTLSTQPHQKRVCIIDTNHELSVPTKNGTSFCETLLGYPKAHGINVATRYMNPEYIVCDEIGGMDEAIQITDAQHCGVPLIASAHADSFSSLLMRKNIAFLLENKVFDSVLQIKSDGKRFEYQIKDVSAL